MDERVEAALEKFTGCFAPDVKGVIERKTESDAHSMQKLVDALVSNSGSSLHRRQMVLFQVHIPMCHPLGGLSPTREVS